MMPEVDKDFLIKEEFDKIWSEAKAEICGDSQIEKMRKTNIEYL